MASTLPQTTPVYFFHQQSQPAGYKEEIFGPWPEGDAIVLKCQFASAHKSPGTRANLHTVTLVVSAAEPVDSPLLLTGPLKRLISYVCTCQTGAGTNRSCAHVCALVTGLMSPDSFKTVKKNVGRRTDLFLPAAQQPTVTGPPSEGRDRSRMFRPAPAPQPRTRDRRGARQPPPQQAHARTQQAHAHPQQAHAPQHPHAQPQQAHAQPQQAHAQPQQPHAQSQQGHGQARAHAHPQQGEAHAHAQQQQSQAHAHAQQQQGQAHAHAQPSPVVLPLQNRHNTCYACSVIQTIHAVDLGRELQPGLTALNDNLTNLVRPILTMIPVETSPPFDLIPVVMSLNLCLPAPDMFQIGTQECAGEFLDSLLLNLNMNPCISSFQEVGICPLCNFPQTSNFNTRSQLLLLIPQSQLSLTPVDIYTEVRRILQGQFFSLTCQTSHCPGFNTRIATQLQCTEQALSIYWIGRNVAGNGIKCLSKVSEPSSNTNLWRGKECVAIIAHTGRSSDRGHWFTFVRLMGIWWRSDTSLNGLYRQDPFQAQLLSTNQSSSTDFTLDIFFFK